MRSEKRRIHKDGQERNPQNRRYRGREQDIFEDFPAGKFLPLSDTFGRKSRIVSELRQSRLAKPSQFPIRTAARNPVCCIFKDMKQGCFAEFGEAERVPLDPIRIMPAWEVFSSAVRFALRERLLFPEFHSRPESRGSYAATHPNQLAPAHNWLASTPSNAQHSYASLRRPRRLGAGANRVNADRCSNIAVDAAGLHSANQAGNSAGDNHRCSSRSRRRRLSASRGYCRRPG